MKFTKEHLEAYHRDGYVIVRNFFTKEEVDLLYKIAIDDDLMSKKVLTAQMPLALKRN